MCRAAKLLRCYLDTAGVWSGAGASCPWVAEEICAQHLACVVQMGGADHSNLACWEISQSAHRKAARVRCGGVM